MKERSNPLKLKIMEFYLCLHGEIRTFLDMGAQ